MSFNPEEGRAEYTASAAQTVFPFAFKIFADTDIKVYQTLSGQTSDDAADILILTTDYTVTINGDLGGTMTLVTGAGIGDSITIVRDLAITRPTEYQTNGDLLATTLNEDQDYQTYLTADRDTTAGRHLTLPDSAQMVSAILPPVIPLSFMQWNASGQALINVTSLQADGFLWTAADVYTKSETYSKTEADTLFAEDIQITDGKKLWDSQTTTHNIATDADYTLTAEQNKYGRVVITDTGVVLTGAINIIADDNQKDFIVQNDILQDLTFKTNTGAGILVLSGTFQNLYNNGTDVISNSNEIGVNQTWQNVIGSRALSVVYTNTTGKLISVNISVSNATAGVINTLLVDGVTACLVSIPTAGRRTVLVAGVPSGATYSLEESQAGTTIYNWAELRGN